MMKKNRKGFTLIELLAVLVVLAILALITTPIVLNIIKNAREEAAERSADAYVRSLDYAVTECMSKHPNEEVSGMTLVNGTKISVEGDNNCSTVETKGKIPEELKTSSQSLSLNNENKITVGDDTTILTIGNYSFRIKNGNAEPVENNTSSKTYELGEEVTYNGIKFYVITDNGDAVTLLKEEPLNIDEVNTYGAGHLNKYTDLSQGTAYNANGNGYGGMAYYTSETCGYVNGSWLYSGCKNNYADSDIKYAVDAWAADKTNDSDLVVDITGYKARLLTYDELQNKLGYLESSKTDSTPDWVFNNKYLYWTMIPKSSSSSSVWIVYYDGRLGNTSVCNRNTVVRPVITVLKSKVQKL